MLRLLLKPKERRTLLLLGIVTIIGYFTYVQGFSNPAAFFWDENYHIASAQKYLSGIYFMEQHPPLGKLTIALGEVLLDRNATDTQFINTDYGTDPPEGFSFTGYRLFPVLFAWLTAPLLFLILWKLMLSDLAAALLSSLYLFDNALIVHLRGAMLEPALLFFAALTMLAFLLIVQGKNDRLFPHWSLLFGLALACVMTTKVVGLVLILLVPAVVWQLWPKRTQIQRFLIAGGLSFLITYVAVWQTHFALGRTVNPILPDQGYYQASEEYKAVLTAGKTASLRWFPVMLRDSLRFVSHYNSGVPRLDLSKPDENGSPWFLWPVGGRAINYRWETPDGGFYQYLYLQVNPVVWWTTTLGIIAAVGLLLASFVLPLREPLRHRPALVIFTGLYFSYMIAIARIGRVMYLYHYFLPLLFSFCVLALVVMELKRMGPYLLTEKLRIGALLCFAALVFSGYQFYRPFTYYEPISDGAFEKRVLLDVWELRCVNCPRESPFVRVP
jgi:dolichyl-phosphate-mannose-protein mannosyltransferase